MAKQPRALPQAVHQYNCTNYTAAFFLNSELTSCK